MKRRPLGGGRRESLALAGEPDGGKSSAAQRQTLAGNLQPWKPLDVATATLIRQGDVHGEFVHHDGTTDWPALLCSVALRLWNHGRDVHEYLAVATDPDNAISAWYRSLRRGKGHRAAEQWLQQRWHRAGSRPPPRRPHLELEAIERFLADARDRHDWSGKAGATDRAVLCAHVSIALRRGDRTYAASARQLAERAGARRQTASKATARLIDRGLLARIGRNDQQTNRYRLRLSPGHTRTSRTALTGGLVTGALVTNDAFRWNALGPNAAAVYAALAQDEQTVAELAAVSGVKRRTVLRCLHRLAEQRLAIDCEEGRWARGYGDPNDAAQRLGTFGRAIFDKARHDAEREVWRARRTDRPRSGSVGHPADRGRVAS